MLELQFLLVIGQFQSIQNSRQFKVKIDFGKMYMKEVEFGEKDFLLRVDTEKESTDYSIFLKIKFIKISQIMITDSNTKTNLTVSLPIKHIWYSPLKPVRNSMKILD